MSSQPNGRSAEERIPTASSNPKPPDELCDMTFGTNLMVDPVVASDGFTYERESIEQWMTSHDASPTTSQPLEHKMLIPNHLVRKQVVSWCEQNGLPVPEVPKRPVAKAVAGGGAAAPLVQKPVVMCELHPKEQLRVFCVNCHRAVCFMCAVDIDMCKSHDIKAFDPLIEELKTDIEGWARALRECNEAAELTCALIQADGDTKKRVYVQEIDKQVAALLQQVRSSSAARAAAMRAILQKRQAREELVTGAAASPEVGVKGSSAAVAVAAAVGRVKAPIPPASAAEFRAAAAAAAAVGQVIVASDVIDSEDHAARFPFTSNELTKCIQLLHEQLVSDYTTFEASLEALEATLLHEVGELTALASKPYAKIEDKDIQRVFEVSSGIIRFGSEVESLLDQFCPGHLFRSMVGEAPHNLSSFVKKVLVGYESQLTNCVQLADLSVKVQKLGVILQDPGLQCWGDAKKFIEKCSKISQRCEKAIQSVEVFVLGCDMQAMGAAGREVVEDAVNFPQFKAVKNAQFNKQTEGVSIQHVLTEMKQPKPDDSSTGRVPTPEGECERIRDLLKRYQETEESHLRRYLKGYADFSCLSETAFVRQLHDQAQALRQTWQPIPIIELLAGIGAVWTMTASGKEFWDSGRKKETLLRLHNVQVIGLIRLLKLSEEQRPLVRTGLLSLMTAAPLVEGHMIQVGTGEGKSVILGVLSCFLAMTGIHVRCACYSQLLSRRDYSDFETLFKKFNVESLIRYSTIDELAEECINDKGDIRSLALCHVGRSSVSASARRSHAPAPVSKKILLIDEVDVFFSNTFMGQSYNPTALLGCDNTIALMRHIWHNRQQPPHAVLSSLMQSPQYASLKEKTFSPAAASIVDRELANMIADAAQFNDPPYEVFNAAEKGAEAKMRVGYKRLDGMTEKLTYGYKTAFAWLCEAEKKTVPSEMAQKFLQFQIPCGRFSYASIPKQHFNCVLGVTGTLSCLTANERKLILDDYKIGPQHMTYLPSLYGPSNMKFNGKDHFVVDPNEQRWQQTILKRINDEAVTRGRPVLVFFESEERISEFLSSDYGRRMPPHQLIVESTIDVPFRVSKATAPSQVTLLSRVFGRGLDFKVNHPSIESADGVCVICTFFPDSASEEIQIKGRAARQGKKGTFEFILCQPDVQRDFSATPEQLKDSPYEFLVKQRTTQTDQLLDGKIERVKRCAPDHEKSMLFARNLQSLHPQADAIFQSIQGFLTKTFLRTPIHTIFCLDNSGSMSESWGGVKRAVRAFIEIRKDLGSPADPFSCIQFSSSTEVSFQQAEIETALNHASKLTFRGGGTLFSPALQAVSGLVHPGQQVAIVFMAGGASSDNPIAVAQSIMGRGAQISFFGVAFTPEGKTKILQDMVQTFNGILVKAANVKELYAQFRAIAQDPTRGQSSAVSWLPGVRPA